MQLLKKKKHVASYTSRIWWWFFNISGGAPGNRADMHWPTTHEVVTSYNNRVYRIKSVHFDMDPNSFFDMRRKGDKDVKISHLDFWWARKIC